ncbi:ABC transporter substrate-binding protein [Microbacterium rhizophilus]|uniref:ABC transporter substrate-binding protein n=1 Tax=Microbacterium rhizophilus TaxID=3138934 RepID=UPI0031EB6A14
MITAVQPRGTGSAHRRRFRTTATALLAAGALALSACSSTQTPAAEEGEEAPADLTKMVVVSFLPLESFTFTPEMYAYASGLFEEHGLDVQLQPVQGTAAAIQTLIGGATPITRVSTVDVLPGMEEGQPIVAIGTMAYRSNLRIISTADNPIEDAADMEGATIGMGSVGGTSEKMLNFALDDAGVPRDSVTRQAVPVTAATYELVKQGQLDGYIVSLDTSIAITNQNEDAVSSPAGLVDAPERQVWITTQTNTEDEAKKEQITAFLAAIKESTQALIDDADNDFANVLKTIRDSGDFTFAALEDDAIAVEALKTYTSETWIDSTGAVGLLENDDAAWTDIYDSYVEGGLLKGGAKPEDWITSDLLPAD